jgi:hypothetical protein
MQHHHYIVISQSYIATTHNGSKLHNYTSESFSNFLAKLTNHKIMVYKTCHRCESQCSNACDNCY